MTLELYTELKNEINERVDKADLLVNSFPKGEMGLVKMTDEFRSAKRNFDIAFSELRTLNGSASNKLKKEYSLLKRRNRRRCL
tara:strand:- start:691 stop:939 length:249 start_codon:yes stop_codon:yes gene_type:complete